MDFESMSLSELKAFAKEHNVKGVTALRKNELVEKLSVEFSKEKQKPAEDNQEIEKKEDNESKAAVSEQTGQADDGTDEAGSQKKSGDGSEAESSGAKEGKDDNYKILHPQNEQKASGGTSGRTRAAGAGLDASRTGMHSSEGYQQRNSAYGMRQPQGEAGVYQHRYADGQNNYQSRYMQNSPNSYQTRFPQTNQGVYPSRYPQNGQNYSQGGQPSYSSRYPQNAQGMYGSRYPQNNPVGTYTSRYQQENENYYQRAQDGMQNNDWNKPIQEQRPAYQHTVEPQGFIQGGQPVSEPVNERVLLDTGISKEGVLELIKSEGYGFLRCENYLPGEDDVYVSPTQVRKFNLKTGDLVKGNLREKNVGDKYQGLAFVETVNGEPSEVALKRPKFEDLTPIFPHERIHFETPKCTPAMRLVDILSPVGKGQRGMIVSQPKAGKTTLLKQIANSIIINHPEMKIIILLIDERPEEVTDIKESIVSENVEVIYSTFDELPENHKRVSEMVIERGKRLVEQGKDVCILLDSITRLARAYNITVTNSGRTLSGGLDPSALYMPKKFFGAARCMREGGSLTILATALVETGSRMDDVVFEEFKGTGNMELVLDRSLSEKRIFPAIDLPKSGTRREDLLLSQEEMEASYLMRTALNGAKSEEAIEVILNYLRNTGSNKELVNLIRTRGIFAK